MDNNELKVNVTSKILETFFDAITRGIGALYEPTHIRRVAKAKADEKIILAKAEIQVRDILSAVQPLVGDSVPFEQLQPIVSRMVSQELRKKENIDEVVKVAYEDLSKTTSVPKEKADTDWLTRFFNIVENVSDEELRNTWGKILSQEIQSPGSYSLRTLNTISNLSKKEAELFSKLGDYIFDSSRNCFLLRNENDVFGVDISYSDILQLMECGLIKESHDLNLSYTSDKDNNKKCAFIYQDLAIVIEMLKGQNIEIPNYELTTAGSEVYKILNVERNMPFLQNVANLIKQDNIHLGYAKITERGEDFINTEEDITYL